MIRLLLTSFALLAACTAEVSTASSSAGSVTGSWSEETGTESHGMTIDFDANSGGVFVHTAPDESGNHDHVEGTFTVDAATGEVTVKCELAGAGNGDMWKGKVDADHLTLTAGDKSIKLHKAGAGHSHK